MCSSDLTDLLGGQVDYMFDSITSAKPHIDSGKLTAIAVTTSKRSSALPNVPTVAEAGVPGYAASNWYGIAVPARTPAKIIARLNEELNRATGAAATRERLFDIGMEPESGASARFAEFVKSEIAKWANVVKVTGLKAD